MPVHEIEMPSWPLFVNIPVGIVPGFIMVILWETLGNPGKLWDNSETLAGHSGVSELYRHFPESTLGHSGKWRYNSETTLGELGASEKSSI